MHELEVLIKSSFMKAFLPFSTTLLSLTFKSNEPQKLMKEQSHSINFEHNDAKLIQLLVQ